MSVSMMVRPISDPFNGTDKPKMIPGAVVEYCVAVSNHGTEAAQDVRINIPVLEQVTVMNDTASLYDAGCGDTPAGTGQDVAINQSDGTIEALIGLIAPGTTWSARFNATIN